MKSYENLRKEIYLPPKEDNDLPDYYGITVTYLDRSVEKFEGLALFVKDFAMLEITKAENDLRLSIPFVNIKKIEFDGRFSKYLECLRKIENKNNENNIEPVIN